MLWRVINYVHRVIIDLEAVGTELQTLLVVLSWIAIRLSKSNSQRYGSFNRPHGSAAKDVEKSQNVNWTKRQCWGEVAGVEAGSGCFWLLGAGAGAAWNKNEKPEPLGKKSGAGAAKKLAGSLWWVVVIINYLTKNYFNDKPFLTIAVSDNPCELPMCSALNDGASAACTSPSPCLTWRTTCLCSNYEQKYNILIECPLGNQNIKYIFSFCCIMQLNHGQI